MNCPDYVKLNRKSLIAYLEKERKEWLDAGMTEADIFRIHFGNDGNGGDYAEWLSERKHTRADHKYALGTQVSLDSLTHEGRHFSDRGSCIGCVELLVDVERAMSTLTEWQRKYFVLAKIYGYNNSEIARLYGKNEATVREAIELASRKTCKYFE